MTNEVIDVSQAMIDYMMPYSKHVITDRAIVDLRDGLKPSQRLGLWSMYEAGLTHKKRRMKSVGVSGLILKYHPHSDQSVYETMTRLAQKDSLLHTLVDGKGNMGQRTGRDVNASASRYTEMRMSEFSEELFDNINKDAVDMVNNFDDTLKQPVVLPAKFPSVLVFGSSGIAVGFSSNIPSHNLSEVCDYTVNIIKGIEQEPLIPDFATGGKIIYDKEQAIKNEESGDAKFLLRGTWHMDDDIIVIDSIPFTTTREAIIERIVSLVSEGKIKEIRDVRDSTDLGGMKIEIDIKKNVDPEMVIAKLYKFTPLEGNFSVNMNVIFNDKPVKLGTRRIVEEWVNFRIETLRRVSRFELEKNNQTLHILKGLSKMLLDIDKAIDIIKKSESDDETLEGLMKEFDLDKQQAEVVSNLKLKNLNKSYINSRLKSIDKLKANNKKLSKIIKDDGTVKKYIIKQLEDIKSKYGKERTTKIVTEESPNYIDTSDITTTQIDDYNVRVFITRDNYVKKIPLTSLRGDFKIVTKHGDEIVSEVETTNTEEVLVFTDKQNVYKKRLYELPDSKPSDLGVYIQNEIGLEADEKILYITALNSEHSSVVIGYSDGKVAKIDLESYRTKTNRSVLRKGYADKTALLFKTISEDFDLMAIATNKKAVLMNTGTINSKATKATQGNTFIKLKDGAVVEEYIVNPEIDDIEYYRLKSASVGKYLKENFSKK